ncbi:acyl--CoA ligase [Myceligenerans sp. TRM 65318]|uniref:Acyl--CoA ligase n=1 Tax=Myceligenerans pegani TaxID=2776917 RepID=A0ABR9N5R1_9MICO|nr:acyl--CoA ligase [Myceligenerans sp. TRM 65318]MBE3020740.1 acyl--CoA ligase [Myceligenerans sp. TRM 65318]
MIPLRAPAGELLGRIRRVREAGDVPLVGDERLPEAQWAAVRDLVDGAAVPPGTAWATLTSGSSGTPRVVLRTAESWSSSWSEVSALLGASDEDRVLCPAPPSSSLTLFSLAHALEGGGPRPVLGRSAAGATCFHGTPQGLRELLAADGPPTVRTALVGGSHLDPALRAAAEARGIRVVAYYGAAELSFVALDDGSGLRPFPGVHVEIRSGQLWVRSPYTALGYLGRPGPLRVDGDWATVGDLAEITGGALRLRGRADGAIVTASATVIPEEVEVALRTVPEVGDAVVFGLPARVVGELVAALIEPVDTGVDVATLRRAAAALLAPASRPRVWFTGQIPRTPAGKPARAETLRRARSGEVARLGR